MTNTSLNSTEKSNDIKQDRIFAIATFTNFKNYVTMFTVGVAARVIYLAALRFLTEVEFQMGLLLVVTSGKGGAGKSTVSVGLASAFSKLNKSVLLIDFDEGLRCLDLMLNVSDKLIFDLSDVICRGKSTDEVALKNR